MIFDWINNSFGIGERFPMPQEERPFESSIFHALRIGRNIAVGISIVIRIKMHSIDSHLLFIPHTHLDFSSILLYEHREIVSLTYATTSTQVPLG